MPLRILIVALVGLTMAGSAGAAERASWTRVAPMLRARAAHAVVTDGRSVYAFGGTNANGAPVLDVERFDGRRWSVVTRLPGGGLNAPAAVALGGRIYVIGGFADVGNVPTAAVRVYDVAARAWSSAAPLPSPRGGHAAVVLGGKIHVLGGGNDVSTLADHSVYDPSADRWSAAAPLPRAKGSPAAAVLGGRIYAIGGRSGGTGYSHRRWKIAIMAGGLDPTVERFGSMAAVNLRLHCDAKLRQTGEHGIDHIRSKPRDLASDNAVHFNVSAGTGDFH